MIKKGDEITVDVSDLTSEGQGISKLEDTFVVFTQNTLPGDKALIKIIKKKSNYAEARLIQIIVPSDFRVIPRCPYFGLCGGCKIQNYDYNKQILYKTNVVKNAFEKIGGFKDLKIGETIKSNEIYYYRNKMEFSFSDDKWYDEKHFGDWEENKFALGLHVPKFHSKILDIHQCFLQSNLSNEILNFSREFFKKRNVSIYSTKTQKGYLRFLIIRESKNTKDVMVNLITYGFEEALMNDYCRELRNNSPDITIVINTISQNKAQIAAGEKEYILYGEAFLREALRADYGKEYMFYISPQSFFQTNTLQAEKLFNTLLKLSDFKHTDNVLDLYCGIGSISIFISGLVKKVLGVELLKDSLLSAQTNAKYNSVKNCEFIHSDIKEFLERYEHLEGYNKLILDPPRSGLHPKICDILAETKFDKIMYISCNPHTQARDLKIICRKGNYEIESMQPLDMFPHTYHIENIAVLKGIE